MIIRRLLHRLGYRYRLHRRDLPGTPDIVLPRLRKIINVHGCFWHMHTCRHARREPKANAGYWRNKRLGNATRDRKNLRRLRRLGWRVLVVWECQLKDREKLAARIAAFLGEKEKKCRSTDTQLNCMPLKKSARIQYLDAW